METITRSERKLLRGLASVAYERELGRALDRVQVVFEAWKSGRSSPHDVSAAIHEFHDGVARDLYVLYTRIDVAQAVARALAHGWIGESEIPPHLLAKLEQSIAFYRSEVANSSLESQAGDQDSTSGSVRLPALREPNEHEF
jgi:hypothetical protein